MGQGSQPYSDAAYHYNFKPGEPGRLVWEFGDGGTSTEQNPLPEYKAGRDYTVILDIEGPAGTARRAKVGGVALR